MPVQHRDQGRVRRQGVEQPADMAPRLTLSTGAAAPRPVPFPVGDIGRSHGQQTGAREILEDRRVRRFRLRGNGPLINDREFRPPRRRL